MPPAEVPVEWELGKVAPVDKDNGTRRTCVGEFIVCVGVEGSSAEALKDIGSFMSFDDEELAGAIAESVKKGSLGPFSKEDVPDKHSIGFNSWVPGASKSVMSFLALLLRR